MDRKPKYNIGDRVEIVNYGHAMWQNKNVDGRETSMPVISEDENFRWIDICREAVGQVGIVSQVSITTGVPEYTIEGIKGKACWFTEDQMKIAN